MVLLRGVFTKWYQVGLALGFDTADLDIIQHKPLLIAEGPVGYFREMLVQWLKWSPPTHDLPTILSLCSALRNPFVGDEWLAKGLRKELMKQRGIVIHM